MIVVYLKLNFRKLRQIFTPLKATQEWLPFISQIKTRLRLSGKGAFINDVTQRGKEGFPSVFVKLGK